VDGVRLDDGHLDFQFYGCRSTQELEHSGEVCSDGAVGGLGGVGGRWRMRIRGVVLVAVLGLSACSGGGSSDALNLGTTVATSSSPTAVEVSTTVAAAVVAVSTSVGVETTLPPATVVETTIPVTTVPEPASKEDQVTADFIAARSARQECSYDPEGCEFEAIAVPGSPMDANTHEAVARSIRDNVRGKRGFGDVQVRVESVGFEGDAAYVTACAYDTGVLFDIADPTNSSDDIIVDDSTASYRVRWELHLVADTWLLFNNTSIDQLTAGDLCGF